MQRIRTRLLSEDEVERLEAWQKQLPADLMPPDHESEKEKKNRLSKISKKRIKEIGVLLQRSKFTPVTKELILSNIQISENGCWNWKGCLDPNGYGQLRYLGRNTQTHRVSWELWNGNIPNGLKCLHHCDNPKCCCPSHLFIGTQDDNMKDMAIKRRGIKKLSDCDVISIFKDSRIYKHIAKDYGVTESMVCAIKKRKARTVSLSTLAL